MIDLHLQLSLIIHIESTYIQINQFKIVNKNIYLIINELKIVYYEQRVKYNYIVKYPTEREISRCLPWAGLEPARPYELQILSLLRCWGESDIL